MKYLTHCSWGRTKRHTHTHTSVILLSDLINYDRNGISRINVFHDGYMQGRHSETKKQYEKNCTL